MHSWYTCIRSSLMQASPGHMLFIAHMFTSIISCDLMGQGRATPPDQAQRQSWRCTEPALVLEHSGPWHSWPLLMSAQRSSPSHWALHIPFSCRWMPLVPEEQSTESHSSVPASQTPLYTNTVYGCSFAATKSGLGKKAHRNFSSAVSWNNNLLKKDFEM